MPGSPSVASTPRRIGTGPSSIDKAFSHFVEPELIQPTIVHDYPIEISPFARATDGDPTLTERFEFFIGGMELGNAFSEINDAETQQARFDQQARQLEGEPGDPGLRRGPFVRDAADRGLGLGIDRLVMLLTGRETIRDVVLFPGAALDVGRRRPQPRSGGPARNRSRRPGCRPSDRSGSHPIAARILSVDGIR